MTTPRVTIEDLALDSSPNGAFELLAHRTSDGREVRITLASALALVNIMTGGTGWTIAANAPANPTLGQGWFDSANGEFRIWTGEIWELIGPLDMDGFHDAMARMAADRALSELATEVRLRTSGDDMQSIAIGSLAQLNSTLSAQETSDMALELVFIAEVTLDATTFPVGQVAFVPPRSRGIESRFVLPQGGGTPVNIPNTVKAVNEYLADPSDTAPFRVYQANGVPGILDVTDLDGDYLLVVKDPGAMVRGVQPLVGNLDRINGLEVFIFNQDIGTRVHRVDAFTYGSDSFVLPFNVSAAEETGAASRVTATGNVVWAVAVTVDGGVVGNRLTYTMTINPAFQAPQTGGGGGDGVDQRARDAAAAAQSIADANTEAIAAVVDDIQRASLHVSLLWPDGTSQPLSYMTARTLAELFQRNDSGDVAVQNARSPIGFQIEGYIEGFDGIANLRDLRINGEVARDNSALTFEERIGDGHFNLVGHPTNRAIGNIIGNLSQGRIAFAINYTIGGQNGTYEVRLPMDTRPPRELPDRIPYIHPDYFLEDVARRISELQVSEAAPIWEDVDVTAGQIQMAAIAATSPAGMAILGGTFNPSQLPPETVWGYTFTQQTTSTQRIVILVRIPQTAVDREDQLDDRYRLEIARQGHATVYTTVGGPIATGNGFYYLHVTGAEASPSVDIAFTIQQLTNPYRTVYNDLLGPRAIASIPGGGGGEGGGLAAPTSRAMTATDRFVYIQQGAAGVLNYAATGLTGMIDRFRSGMAEATSSAKGLLSAALFNKLTALPTRAALTAELNAIVAASNFLVDDPTSPIAPTDANADKILVRGGRLFENILHSATNPQVTYRDFTQADWRTAVGDNNAEWGGAVQVTTPANQHPANYGLYSIPGGHFLRRVGSGFPANYGEFTPTNWRGPAGSEDEADERVTAIGDIVYYGGSVRVVTAFTAGTTRHRTWEPIESIPSEASVTFDKLAAVLLASQAEVASGETEKLATAAIIRAFVNNRIINGFATYSGGLGLRLRRAGGANNVDIPMNRIVNSGTILNGIQPTRTSADRGKVLTVASTSENLLSLESPESTALQPNSVTAAQARANTAAHKKEWRDRIEAMRSPAIRNSTFDTSITAADIDRTVQFSGAVARRFTLPDIDGTSVVVGATVHIVNDGTATLTLDGANNDTIEGQTTYPLLPHQAVTVQAQSSSQWVIISDAFLGATVEWNDIPSGTPIIVGQVVTHASAYWGAQVAHNRVATGPDGDSTNWIRLSNWAGAWSAGYYPAGTMMSHASAPWIAMSDVLNSDPAPDNSANTKWVRMTGITTAEATTIANQRAAARFTDAEKTKLADISSLWNARGMFAVRTAYAVGDVVVYNNHIYYVAAAVPASNTANPTDGSTWVLLSADPLTTAAILGLLNAAITPTQMNADAASEKAAFRALFNSNNIGVGNAFPAATATNAGDVHIFAAAVASGLSWRDRDGTTVLTSAAAGDVAIYVGGRFWQRIGNLSDPLVHLPQLRAQTITSASAITWNVVNGATGLLTLGVNTTLRMSGGSSGDTAQLVVTQDGTGSRTLTLHSSITRFSGIAAPVLKTDANAVDVLLFLNIGGTWNFLGLVGAAAAAPEPKDLVAQGNQNLTLALNRWLITNIDIPSDAMWGAADFGDESAELPWFSWAKIRGYTAQTSGGTYSAAQGANQANLNINADGGIRAVSFGKGPGNKLAVATSRDSVDPMPLTVYKWE